MKNRTWRLVPKPQDRKTIGCRWVFKVKHKADGSVERFKARLVVKGYAQQYGIDYNDTFSPVARYSSIRCVIAIATQEDMELHQMDVDTAFLNGDIEEDIYMDQPTDYVESSGSNMVCKLQRSLYGLKQAPRVWNNVIDKFLKQSGYVQSQADVCIYVKDKGGEKTIIALYVDDLLIACSNDDSLQQVKKELANRFNMKDLGPAKFILGLEITRDRRNKTTYLSQEKYITDILNRFNMKDAKPMDTPQAVGEVLSKDDPTTKSEDMKAVPYRNAVGSIMYAMIGTRPDIAVATSTVSRFLSEPGLTHWKAVKRILRYLKGTKDLSIVYTGSLNKSITLEGYCDADWGGDKTNRHSITGFIFQICGGAVSWNSKKQPTIALSSTEAEYMNATQAAKETVWLRQLLKDMEYEQKAFTILHKDNQGCILLLKNPVYHARTKHIDI